MQRSVHLSFGWVKLLWTGRKNEGAKNHRHCQLCLRNECKWCHMCICSLFQVIRHILKCVNLFNVQLAHMCLPKHVWLAIIWFCIKPWWPCKIIYKILLLYFNNYVIDLCVVVIIHNHSWNGKDGVSNETSRVMSVDVFSVSEMFCLTNTAS